jgi:hypothetical protein
MPFFFCSCYSCSSFEFINIPATYEAELNQLPVNPTSIKKLLTTLINLNSSIKWETNAEVLLESTLLLEIL